MEGKTNVALEKICEKCLIPACQQNEYEYTCKVSEIKSAQKIKEDIKNLGWSTYGLAIGTSSHSSVYVISPIGEGIPSKKAAYYNYTTKKWRGGNAPNSVKLLIENNIYLLI